MHVRDPSPTPPGATPLCDPIPSHPIPSHPIPSHPIPSLSNPGEWRAVYVLGHTFAMQHHQSICDSSNFTLYALQNKELWFNGVHALGHSAVYATPLMTAIYPDLAVTLHLNPATQETSQTTDDDADSYRRDNTMRHYKLQKPEMSPALQ